jgi:hypothetical protein
MPSLWAVAPKRQPEEELQKCTSSSAAVASMPSFEASSNFQLLDRQAMFLQQRKEQVNLFLMERALLLHQHHPTTAVEQQQQERLFQMRQMMQLGMQRAHHQPLGDRASAA